MRRASFASRVVEAEVALFFEISEQVRETIQAKLLENLVKRGSAFV